MKKLKQARNNSGFRIIPINPLKGNLILKIYVTGAVISEHLIRFPTISNVIPNIEGTNVPMNDSDIGTPDHYLFDDLMLLDNKAMKINCDIYNVLEDEVKFSLYISCIQDGNEHFIYELKDSKVAKESMVNFYFWSIFKIEVEDYE